MRKTGKSNEANKFVLFETEIGTCGIGWNLQGITRIHLPEPGDWAMEEYIKRGYQPAKLAEMPDWAKESIKKICLLFSTGKGDLSKIPLDMENIPEFHRKVYGAALKIPAGKVKSYGELAAECGSPGAARAVGQAMARNPFPPVVPCHRVISASGKPGGFSAYGGVSSKVILLSIEGVELPQKS